MSENMTIKIKKDEQGNLVEECEYLGDKIHGTRTIWHPTGVKISETSFKNGIMQGKHTSWYLSGQTALDAEVVGGNYHGLFIAYWPNGEKREQGCFEKGERVGVFESWSDAGELMAERNYDDK